MPLQSPTKERSQLASGLLHMVQHRMTKTLKSLFEPLYCDIGEGIEQYGLILLVTTKALLKGAAVFCGI